MGVQHVELKTFEALSEVKVRIAEREVYLKSQESLKAEVDRINTELGRQAATLASTRRAE